MAHDWNIRARSSQCWDCQKPFEKGETCISALHYGTQPDGAPFIERADRCVECRKKVDEATLLSVWQSPYIPPEPPPPDPAPKQTVEALLRRFLEDDASDPAVTYVLAVMLERKKILLERDAKPQPDGTMLRVYEHRKTNEVFLISDPGLQLDRLQPIQEQVAALLAAKGDATQTHETV